jgi:hypothetical protein
MKTNVLSFMKFLLADIVLLFYIVAKKILMF